MSRRRKVVRLAPQRVRIAWSEKHWSIFLAPEGWTPPAVLTATVVRRTQVATYKAVFTTEDGAKVVARTRVQLGDAGGEIIERSISRQFVWRPEASR